MLVDDVFDLDSEVVVSRVVAHSDTAHYGLPIVCFYLGSLV